MGHRNEQSDIESLTEEFGAIMRLLIDSINPLDTGAYNAPDGGKVNSVVEGQIFVGLSLRKIAEAIESVAVSIEMVATELQAFNQNRE